MLGPVTYLCSVPTRPVTQAGDEAPTRQRTQLRTVPGAQQVVSHRLVGEWGVVTVTVS